jgi:Short C-terminal domain
VGLFDFLKRKDEKATPEPGTPEFEAAVKGTAIPDSQSVDMGESGWTSGDADVQQTSQTIDLRGTGAREDVEKVLREHGIDPDKEGQTIDASTVPGLQEAIMGALGQSGVNIPEAGGFAGGVSPPPQDPIAVIEHLAAKRDAGEITDAEFEAQKKKLLGSG